MSSPFPKPEKYNYKYFRFLIWLSYRGRGNNHQTTKKRCILSHHPSWWLVSADVRNIITDTGTINTILLVWG